MVDGRQGTPGTLLWGWGMPALKQAVFGFMAVVAGALGVDLFLPDTGGISAVHLLPLGAYFLVAGACFGYLNARLWVASGLVAWGGVVATFAGFADQGATWTGAGVLAATLGLALLGGYTGAKLAASRVQRRAIPER